jgi:pimeloyl-ACP methyl ester carboxylesterase
MSVRVAKTYHLHLHFFHGWGFDATYWDPFLKVFRAKMESLQQEYPLRIDGITLNVHDEGYFGGRSFSEDVLANEGNSQVDVPKIDADLGELVSDEDIFSEEDISGPKSTPLNIVLAHSFGLHKWSYSHLKPDIICISGGFLGFHDAGGARSKRVVDKMITAFESDPGAVLSAFYGNVFHPRRCALSIPEKMNEAKLLQDLRILNSVSISPNNIKNSDKILLLQGILDLIVQRSHVDILANEIPDAKVLLVDKAGHGVFFTNPVETCDFLLKCLESEYLSA